MLISRHLLALISSKWIANGDIPPCNLCLDFCKPLHAEDNLPAESNQFVFCAVTCLEENHITYGPAYEGICILIGPDREFVVGGVINCQNHILDAIKL